VAGPDGSALAARPGEVALGRLGANVSLPYSEVLQGWVKVLTPCEREGWMPLTSGSVLPSATVVLDPGHGGDENGATGSGGLPEKEVNLEVARRAAEALRSQGVAATVTRTADYRATLAFRARFAAAAHAAALVSIHHNSDPDGPLPRPGTETYFQYRSPESRRLAGLLYEEAAAALARFPASWVGDTDAGAKWRLNSAGGDYYGILRRPAEAGVVASLAELAFVSNPSEEELLRREDVRSEEAAAVARAIVRFLRTTEAGSGFTTPYPRSEPAGPGGGRTGCRDPS
jgi:N-acetylmuramoyl-L-alanine amidase